MTTPTDPPEWALEEARQTLRLAGIQITTTDFVHLIAWALVATRRRGIEEAAPVLEAARELASKSHRGGFDYNTIEFRLAASTVIAAITAYDVGRTLADKEPS